MTSVTFLPLLRVAAGTSLSPLVPFHAMRHRHPLIQLSLLISVPQFFVATVATEGRADSVGVTRHADTVSPQPVRFTFLR